VPQRRVDERPPPRRTEERPPLRKSDESPKDRRTEERPIRDEDVQPVPRPTPMPAVPQQRAKKLEDLPFGAGL
jgi:hypothetical protein